MKQKLIITGPEARELLITGANYLADPVKSTLGPFGTNFFLVKGNRYTNDGATIAREIEHPDERIQRGVVALREAILKANDEAGDGSTTTAILAQAILKEASIKMKGKSSVIGSMTPIELIRQLAEELKVVIEELRKMSKPVTTLEELLQSALVSAEDANLANLIGETQWALGPEGVLIAEETADPQCSIEKVNGIKLDNGFGAPIMMNNPEKQSLDITKTKTLLTNHTITNMEPLLPVFIQLSKSGVRCVTVIARAFSAEAIKFCEKNIQEGFSIFPINAPYTDQNEVMKDLETVLGGKYINTEASDLDGVQVSDFGYAEKIEAKMYSAVITGVKDIKAEERIANRVEFLTKKLGSEPSVFEKKNIKARVAQLTNGFAVIKVGAPTDGERKYLKDKADDAVNAVQAAFQEGVVPGAGLALKAIADALPDTYILKRPLCAVYEQITSSSPKDFAIPEWVNDPVKVLRISLEKAVSVAGQLATVGGFSADEKDKPMWVQQVAKN